jgi:hypothetical protein
VGAARFILGAVLLVCCKQLMIQKLPHSKSIKKAKTAIANALILKKVLESDVKRSNVKQLIFCRSILDIDKIVPHYLSFK